MCGIVAIVGPLARERERMDSALDALAPRGPDGAGTWRSRDGLMALGHRRLATVGGAQEKQPVTNEDESILAAVNGELYGAAALRETLERRGHRVRSRIDSELLVHLWEEEGPACLSALQGELAFALVDQRDRTLTAGRDRFGIKPLCFAKIGESVAFASEAKALFALGVEAQWDLTALRFALSFQYLPPERTLFRGVNVVPPGGLVRVALGTRGGVEVVVASPPQEQESANDLNEHEAPRLVRDALEAAVRDRLVADVPVAFQLSGGIDSAGVVGLAARQMRARPSCFTVRFLADDGVADEEEADGARETAQHVGADLQIVDVTPQDICAELERAVVGSEGLAINGHLIGKHMMARTVRRAGFKVVLSGEGADELFLGYSHFRMDLWRARNDATSLSLLNDLTAAPGVSSGVMLPRDSVDAAAEVLRPLGHTPAFLNAKLQMTAPVRRAVHAGIFDGGDVERALIRLRPPRLPESPEAVVEASSALWSRLALTGYILRTLGDGCEMPHGVEGRVPFLDPRVASVARQIPLSQKIAGATSKAVLREALRKVVSARAYAAPKHPFLGRAYARSPIVLDFAHDLLASTSASTLFARAEIERFLGPLRGSSAATASADDPALFMMMTLAALQRGFGISL